MNAEISLEMAEVKLDLEILRVTLNKFICESTKANDCPRENVGEKREAFTQTNWPGVTTEAEKDISFNDENANKKRTPVIITETPGISGRSNTEYISDSSEESLIYDNTQLSINSPMLDQHPAQEMIPSAMTESEKKIPDSFVF